MGVGPSAYGSFRDVPRRTVVGGAGLGITSLVLPDAAAASSDTRTLGLENTPATSAAALLADGWTADGWYWIRTSGMSAPRRVWCDLTDAGGGWMLIAYAPSMSTTGVRYPNVWQGGQGALDRLVASTMDLWFHDGVAQCDSVMKMASTVAGAAPSLSAMQIANRVTYTNPGDLNLATYDPENPNDYSAAKVTKLDGIWHPVKGHTLMTGPLNVDAPRHWIYVSNSWWTTCDPSTDPADGGGGSGVATASWTHPTNGTVYGVADVAVDQSSSREDVGTYAVYIR